VAKLIPLRSANEIPKQKQLYQREAELKPETARSFSLAECPAVCVGFIGHLRWFCG
jgi:hypothetical protein